MTEQRNQRSKSRRTLQAGGGLTAENARKELHQAGVRAREQERLRKKRVAALRKANQPVLPEDQELIPDPEAIAQMQVEQQAVERDNGSSGSSGQETESSVEFHL